MEKYLKLFMVALFATLTFSLTSCGDDDEPDDPNVGKATLTVNGVKYPINPYMTSSNSWDDGEFTVHIIDKNDAACFYTFGFTPKGDYVKVGDDFASMSLTVQIFDCTDATMSTLNYSSGSANVKAVGKDTITVEFKNLKMSGKEYMSDKNISYTFDGTVTIDFEK